MGLNTRELIDKIENLGDDGTLVEFNFGGYPYYIDSWRGSYRLPALYYSFNWEDHKTKKEFLEELRSVEGKKVVGYKGGDFILSETDTVWVTHGRSVSGNTTIEYVTKEDYAIILHIKYEEY